MGIIFFTPRTCYWTSWTWTEFEFPSSGRKLCAKMADKGGDSSEEEDPTITEDLVVTKYKMAGDMANRK